MQTYVSIKKYRLQRKFYIIIYVMLTGSLYHRRIVLSMQYGSQVLEMASRRSQPYRNANAQIDCIPAESSSYRSQIPSHRMPTGPNKSVTSQVCVPKVLRSHLCKNGGFNISLHYSSGFSQYMYMYLNSYVKSLLHKSKETKYN